MPQLLTPDDYADLDLPDQWLEDCMQQFEAAWLVEQTQGCERVLELGWGSGIVANALNDEGKEVHVVEGSMDFCEKAQRAGMITHLTMFEDFVAPHRYDCVIASFVLEHIQDPVKLLTRCHEWADKLIVVFGNANSYHRQLAVKMGLQDRLDTLSKRDKQVGHYRVYDLDTINHELKRAGWHPQLWHGLMFKPLPNFMMAGFQPRLIRAMNEIPIPMQSAANIGIVCRPY